MRFIQIGVGGFGRCWVGVLKAERKAKVVGLVDVSPEALRAACDQGGYDQSICYPTLEAALREVEADAAVVVTPPKLHRTAAVAAMKAGLHVISEKPMAEDLADCKAMLKAAKRYGKTLVISQNYRYKPAIHAMADMVQSGRLGAIGQVKLDFYLGNDFGGGFRHTMEYPLIVDMSIHHVDLIRYVTGLDACTVRASAWNPSWSNYKGDCSSTALYEMENGARVLYNGSWCAKGQFSNWDGNWQIEGEKGTLCYQNGEVTFHEVPDLYRIKKTRRIKPKAMRRQGQNYVLAEFMKCLADGTRPATDVYDNIRSVSMVFATVKAMRTGRTVPILDKATRDLLRSAR